MLPHQSSIASRPLANRWQPLAAPAPPAVVALVAALMVELIVELVAALVAAPTTFPSPATTGPPSPHVVLTPLRGRPPSGQQPLPLLPLPSLPLPASGPS